MPAPYGRMLCKAVAEANVDAKNGVMYVRREHSGRVCHRARAAVHCHPLHTYRSVTLLTLCSSAPLLRLALALSICPPPHCD
eukprot:6834713-Pyramimonas_sp.AAC.1